MRANANPTARSVASLIALGALAFAPIPARDAGASGLQQPPLFRTRVGLTRVKVAVLDDDGRPVQGLRAEDFTVLEDGVQQQVKLVLDPVSVHMDVALVLDFSNSIRRDWSETAARRAAHEFLDRLDPDDCVYLLPFHYKVGPGVWGGPGDPALRNAIDSYSYAAATRLYDAILAAHEALDRRRPDSASAAARELDNLTGSMWMEPVREVACGEPLSPDEAAGRRAALVVLTDGEDLGSQASYSDVLMASWHSEVPVFAVAVGMAARQPRYRGSGWNSHTLYRKAPSDAVLSRERWENIRTLQEQLREIARVSGGQLVLQQDLRDGYAHTIGLLRGYYVLGYRTPEPIREGWHRLEVKVRGKGREAIVQPCIYRLRDDPVAVAGALREASVQFQLGNFERALAYYDRAAAANLDIGTPLFGRGLVLEKMGRWQEARAAFERSLARRPGAPLTHARLAHVTFELGDYAAAWHHALKAHRAGVEMTELLVRLEETAPPPPDKEERLRAPVVHVLAPHVPELDAQLALRDLLRALDAALDALPDVALAVGPEYAEYTLSVWVRKIEPGPPRRLVARLLVQDSTRRRLHQEPIEIEDLDAPEAIEAAVRQAVRGAHGWLRER